MSDQAIEAVEPSLEDLIDQSLSANEPGEEVEESEDSGDEVIDDESIDDDDQSEQDEPTKVEPQAIKIKLKNETGEEVEEEFSPDELAASVMRHRDYTRKTQELSAREREAVQLVQERYAQTLSEGKQFVDEHLQIVEHALGMLSADKLDGLKERDFQSWAEAIDRRSALESAQRRLRESQSQLQKQQAEVFEQQRNEMARQTWQVLEGEGIGRSDIEKAFAAHAKYYGQFGKVSYDSILDPVSVMTIKDAVAYRALKEKSAQTTKQVQQQPKMPKGKAPTQRQTRRSKELDKKFASGKANVRDLASLIESMQS